MPNPIVDKPTCHPRRHMTPSQFMTYDAMRGMAKKPELKAGGVIYPHLVCYAQLITITNHTSLGKNQNRDNIKALIEKGWLIPEDKIRWRQGLWANNRYAVLEHSDYEAKAQQHEGWQYSACPSFKFEAHTGENLKPATPADRKKFEQSTFAVNAAHKRAAARIASATHEEREAWATFFREADKRRLQREKRAVEGPVR